MAGGWKTLDRSRKTGDVRLFEQYLKLILKVSLINQAFFFASAVTLTMDFGSFLLPTSDFRLLTSVKTQTSAHRANIQQLVRFRNPVRLQNRLLSACFPAYCFPAVLVFSLVVSQGTECSHPY